MNIELNNPKALEGISLVLVLSEMKEQTKILLRMEKAINGQVKEDIVWEIKDVCKKLKVSESWVRDRVSSGKLPSFRLDDNKNAPLRFWKLKVVEHYKSDRSKQFPECLK